MGQLTQPPSTTRVIYNFSLCHLIRDIPNLPWLAINSFTGSYRALVHPITRNITGALPLPPTKATRDSDKDSLFDTPPA